jgi:hypothetical protein
MPNVVKYASFGLKDGAYVPDFLLASDKFTSGCLSAQKGYISRKLLAYGDRWADSIIWETVDDAQNAEKTFGENIFAGEYFAFIDEKKGFDFHEFLIEKSY